jgi:hypothetical protein
MIGARISSFNAPRKRVTKTHHHMQGYTIGYYEPAFKTSSDSQQRTQFVEDFPISSCVRGTGPCQSVHKLPDESLPKSVACLLTESSEAR